MTSNEPISKENVTKWAESFSEMTPESILEKAISDFGDGLAVSFSGAEDVVLVDIATKIDPKTRIFTLDTGRLHQETYEFLEKVRDHYKTNIEVCFPKSESIQELVEKKGFFSFYQDDHSECCAVRKVGPLRDKLSTLKAWVTGQRKDQSPGTRADIPAVQFDKAFSTPENDLFKFNPLVNWTSTQVWSYIRKNKVPYNQLHEKGFISIGCAPCTKAVLPNQHEREGRWWWEEATQKECGLHASNQTKS